MADLKNPWAIYLKGWLFLCCGLVAAILLLMQHPDTRTALLLAICIWSCCRFYYFAFYVIEHYVDSKYRFAGLLDFARYVRRQRLGLEMRTGNDTETPQGS